MGLQSTQFPQFELICHHLARTPLAITIGDGDSFIKVDFPDRPKVQ